VTGYRALVAVVIAATFATPLTAQTAPQASQQTDTERSRLKYQILTMEGVLVSAVNNGASDLINKARRVTRNADMMLVGAPDVRGFIIDGYGILFVVRVPAMSPVFTNYWQRQVRPTQQVRAQSLPAGNVPAEAVPPVVPIDPMLLSDPNAVYTQTVKAKLIDAMLESSGPLRIPADQFLIVAASDNTPPDPRFPADRTDSQTVMFRVKSRDLSDFHEKKITVEAARKLVTITEN
jgi:hypothetical protein